MAILKTKIESTHITLQAGLSDSTNTVMTQEPGASILI